MEFDQKNILFHHTGVITDDIESSISFFSKLGYTTSNIYNDKPQQTFVAILNKTNSPMIELVSPMNSNSPAQAGLLGLVLVLIIFVLKLKMQN